jgi:hypothetical protein
VETGSHNATHPFHKSLQTSTFISLITNFLVLSGGIYDPLPLDLEKIKKAASVS